MIVIWWAIFNLVLAIMTIFGNSTAGVWLACSVLIGWALAVINGLTD